MSGKVAPRKMDGFTRLIEQRYFVVDRFELGATGKESVSLDGAGCLVGLTGRGVVGTPDGELELIPGKAVVVPMGDGSVIVETSSGVTFARCVAPI